MPITALKKLAEMHARMTALGLFLEVWQRMPPTGVLPAVYECHRVWLQLSQLLSIVLSDSDRLRLT
jgi:hypothetical protein